MGWLVQDDIVTAYAKRYDVTKPFNPSEFRLAKALEFSGRNHNLTLVGAIKSDDYAATGAYSAASAYYSWGDVFAEYRKAMLADVQSLRNAQPRINWTWHVNAAQLMQLLTNKPTVKIKTDNSSVKRFFVMRLIGGSLEIATECDLLSTDHRCFRYDLETSAVRWQQVAFSADYDAWQTERFFVSDAVLAWLKTFSKKEQHGMMMDVTLTPDSMTLECVEARQRIRLAYYAGDKK